MEQEAESSSPITQEIRSTVNPMRVVWTSVALLGIGLPLLLLDPVAAAILLAMVIGAGVYLLLRRESKCRRFAAGLLALEALVKALSQAVTTARSLHEASLQASPLVIHVLLVYLGSALIIVAVAAGLALLFSHARRDAPEKGRVYGSGWVAAGGVFLCGAIMALISFLLGGGAMRPAYLWSSILNSGIAAVVVGLSAMLFFGIGQKRPDLGLSAWAKTWCALCTVAMTISLIVILTGESSRWLVVLFLLAGVTGYILLFCRKRSGFFVVLLATSVYLISTFQTLLQNVLFGSGEYLYILLISMLGAANPLITWLSIRQAWRGGGVLRGSVCQDHPTVDDSTSEEEVP